MQSDFAIKYTSKKISLTLPIKILLRKKFVYENKSNKITLLKKIQDRLNKTSLDQIINVAQNKHMQNIETRTTTEI